MRDNFYIKWFTNKEFTLQNIMNFVGKYTKNGKINMEADCTIFDKQGSDLASLWIGNESCAINEDCKRSAVINNDNKLMRVRVASKINFIENIWNSLRKVHYAINQNLKDDLISETIIYFFNRWEKYEYYPFTMANAIQKYKANCIDTYRKEKKNINVKENEEFDTYLPKPLGYLEGVPLKDLEKKQEFKKMQNALSKLSPDHREILMYVAEGKSEKEIMKILKLPRGTVASRKSKSIKKLTEVLKNEDR